MKVVLFCGGLGLRMRDLAGDVPKPLVCIGDQPILLHLMRYYAHYGCDDFVLCLGHRGEMIRDYFDRPETPVPGDWRLTLVETGVDANIGMRLRSVRAHVEQEPWFLANYADGLTDLPLDVYLDFARRRGRVATLLSVPAPLPMHLVESSDDDQVTRIQPLSSAIRVNGGFFVLRPQIFDYLEEGEDLVVEPFRRLIHRGELAAYAYDGFWQAMDTFKDHRRLEELRAAGEPPWEVWRS